MVTGSASQGFPAGEGSVPGRKASRIVFGPPGDAGWPLSRSTATSVTVGGGGKTVPGRVFPAALHEVEPCREGDAGSALAVAERGLLIASDPGPGRHFGIETDEPGVGEVVRGSGLSRHRASKGPCPGGRTPRDHPFQQVGDDIRQIRRDHGSGFRVAAFQFPTVPVGDPGDEIRAHPHPSVGKGAVRRDHLQQRDITRSQSDREHRQQRALDPQPGCQSGPLRLVRHRGPCGRRGCSGTLRRPVAW